MLTARLARPIFWARNIRQRAPSDRSNAPLQPKKHPSPSLEEYQQARRQFKRATEPTPERPHENEGAPHSFRALKAMMRQSVQTATPPVPQARTRGDLHQRMKRMGVPGELLSQSADKSGSRQRSGEGGNSNSGSGQAVEDQELSAVTGEVFDQISQSREQEVAMAQQDLLLAHIVKAAPGPASRQHSPAQEVDQFGGSLSSMRAREETVAKAVREGQDPSKLKLAADRQELLAMKYSPEIIELAKAHRTQELAYLSELIQQEPPSFTNPLHSRHPRYSEPVPVAPKVPPPQERRVAKGKAKPQEGLVPSEKPSPELALSLIGRKQALSREEQEVRAALEEDLEAASSARDVFLDEKVMATEAALQRRVALQESSFGKQQKRLERLGQRMTEVGIEWEPEDLRQLSHESLMQEKGLREEEQRHQMWLERKQQVRRMKKELKAIHQEQLRDDLDFDKQHQAPLSALASPSDPTQLEQQIELAREAEEQRRARVAGETGEERSSRVHREKTFRRMEGFICDHFSRGVFNHGQEQLRRVQIRGVVANRANTLLNVFWEEEPAYLAQRGALPTHDDYEARLAKERSAIQKSLDKQAGYISGRMCQALGLRYGPEIRFHREYQTDTTREEVEELRRHLKEIAMGEVEEMVARGEIAGEEQQAEYFQKMMDIARVKLSNYHNRRLLLTKGYRQRMAPPPERRRGKRPSTLADEAEEGPGKERTRARKARASSVDRLWEQVDLL